MRKIILKIISAICMVLLCFSTASCSNSKGINIGFNGKWIGTLPDVHFGIKSDKTEFDKILYNKATLYRFLALIFSAIEAVFIKKIILLTNIEMCFLYWALAGLFFASIFVLFSRHSIKIQKHNIKYQVLLIFLVALMQYSTNYVFSRINVAYALALFQLSTMLSVFLGIKVFKEEGFCRKMIASLIMLFGAGSIILF